MVISESPEKSSDKRKKSGQEAELSLIEDDGNTTDEFRSPPVKAMRLASEPENDSFSELLPRAVKLHAPRKENELRTNESVNCEEETESRWSCATCTFINHEALPYCEMCSSAKPDITKYKDDRKNNLHEVNSSHEQLPVTKQNKMASNSDFIINDTSVDTKNVNRLTKEKEIQIQGDNGKKAECINSRNRIYLRARKTVKAHEISDSDSEETEKDTFEARRDVRCMQQESNSESETADTNSNSPVKNQLFQTQLKLNDSISTIESIRLFSEDSQSTDHNDSKDSLLIEEYTDTDDAEDSEKGKHDFHGTLKESGMEADNEVTIMENSDSESSPSKRINVEGFVTPQCTPKRQLISQNKGNWMYYLNSFRFCKTPGTSYISQMFSSFLFYLTENLAIPPETEEELIRQESMVAMRLFSPGFNKASELTRMPWICKECNTTNDARDDDCDGCLSERPKCTTNDNQSAKNKSIICDQLPSSQSWKCKECDWENFEMNTDKCEMCCAPTSSSYLKYGTIIDVCQRWTCKNCNLKNDAINEDCTDCTAAGKRRLPVESFILLLFFWGLICI